ncbi:MAG: hypothetical protein ACE5Q9_05755 [Nitrosopumilus sp.]
MNLILMSKQRGTSSTSSEQPVNRLIGKRNNLTQFSTLDDCQKITIHKGTMTRRIIKKPQVAMISSPRIIIVNKGTSRLDLR